MIRRALAGVMATCVCVALHATSASAASGDIVMYASDATGLHGNWTLVADATAAGGQMLSSADKGWSATSAALATPTDYFELTFTAAANTPYHVWFRMRASGGSKFNDSIWAQFSDAVNGSGTAIFPIGSTNGLLVNAQACGSCALSGWGWYGGAYWLTQTNPVTFAASGSHTLRVQTREDGVQIDQVVISPSTYLSSAPGATSNDSVIVSKSVVSTPFHTTPAAIPGTIQAEDFDNGGEGIAYHDLTSGNSGGQYRSTDVDIETATDGAYDVGYISAGEWLNFTVNVASAGSYLFEARVASSGQGGTFHVEFGGTNVTGALTIPNTGGWQTWTTISKTVTLAAGQQVMRLAFDTSGTYAVGNVTWVRFTSAQPTPTATPYGGSPWPVPGTLHAENFDIGGEGIAYHDTTTGNSGGQYRSTDVDIESSGEGGYDVGWIADGEWLAYTVNVAAAGNYTLQLRVASTYSSGRVHAAFNGVSSPIVSVPNTGGWQTYTNISIPVTLAAGTQSMRLVFDGGAFNISTISAAAVVSTDPPPPPPPAPSPSPTTISVPAGGDLQAAINSANPGDTILVQAGATFTGHFVLPVKSGTGTVTIRSSAPDSALPSANTRIDPTYATQLPKLKSSDTMAVLSTAPGAHNYALLFLEFQANVQGAGDIVTLGDGSSAQNSLSMVPHDLVVDRCYLHGDVTVGQKRGIGLNSASTTVTNSYISEMKANGQDSQAIAGWNGPGPYTITNNYLEAAGENVIFGGADPSIPNLIPSDITITGNHFSKQVVWRSQTQWNVKNLLELKNAQRVVIDGNVLEYNWLAAQVGYAILFTPRNQDGTCPWCNVQQVQFTNNLVRHVASGINILGTDNDFPSGTLNNVTIRNNLFEDVSSANWGGDGRFMLVGAGATNVTTDHNTVFQDGYSALYAYGKAMVNFVFTNNIVPDNSWAIIGDNTSPGNGTATVYFPGSTLRDGIFAGSNPATYPAGNYYPSSMSAVGFVNATGGNYRLATTSLYHNAATDGTDVGCNIDALDAAARINY